MYNENFGQAGGLDLSSCNTTCKCMYSRKILGNLLDKQYRSGGRKMAADYKQSKLLFNQLKSIKSHLIEITKWEL